MTAPKSFTPKQVQEQFQAIIEARFRPASAVGKRALKKASAEMAVALGEKATWTFKDMPALEKAMEQALLGSGLEGILDEVVRASTEFATAARKIPGVEFGTSSQATLQGSMEAQTAAWDKLIGDEASGWLRERMALQAAAPVTAQELAVELAEHIDGALSAHVDTYTEDAFSGQARAAWDAVGEELGAEDFEYMGAPPDAVMREFCLDHYGNVYSRDEIAEMDNGQDLDVMAWGGGHNCRHQWVPIPPKPE